MNPGGGDYWPSMRIINLSHPKIKSRPPFRFFYPCLFEMQKLISPPPSAAGDH